MDTVRLQLIYDGLGPVHWSPAPGARDAFGVQDKAGVLHPGTPDRGGALVFDLTLKVKATDNDSPVLSGDFAHGPPATRFLYLGWRHAQGNFAQRLKIPLAGITGDLVRQAAQSQRPLVTTVVDHHPRATRTGENIGGTRNVTWTAS